MKIIVFGATGNTGRRVLAQGVRMGHELTAFVRSPEKLHEQQGEDTARQVNVIAQDIMDPHGVREALSQQDAAIIAAGNAEQGDEFVRIVDNIVSQCEDHRSFAGRVWLMGGAGLLDIPHTDLIGNNLPGFPPMYQTHNRNLERLRQSRLDWSVMCPGTMVDSTWHPEPVRLHATTDALPLSVPETIKELSESDIAGLLFSRLQELNVSYEDVANWMLNHVELDGPYKRKRVGLAYRSDIPAR
ncbi:NAD(P)-dependent oxidoreductase [Cohnella candidum]|uniref:NAD-dependent epimerase/dehydratase family protein n=1 Tax=Cohnella candidum TaxID=2674991 RepID=A0A3G3K2Q0_9BACL|nr:NAD(P)H-binding protein [Cohnella candidum]AYQ74743.1 NAD-dependent epimerase/dehydratase family protein [Cohnella candidum]